jgi:hypothetical protein
MDKNGSYALNYEAGLDDYLMTGAPRADFEKKRERDPIGVEMLGSRRATRNKAT